jgi:hypothetical protein
MAFAMAISTANFTFADFRLDRLPGVTQTNHPADLHMLFPANMVKIEAAGIVFPTIDTRMQYQVIQDPLSLHPSDARRSLACLAYVVILVSLIVQPNLRARTYSAVNLSQPSAFILEVEFCKPFFFAALPAGPGFH